MPKISGLPPITTPASDDELPLVDKDQSTTKKVTVSQLLPPGTIMDYAGASAPGGWLLCFGQALNASTSPEYQALYDAIGNTYGGTNNTDFVVPDLRGRVIAGKDDMGGSSANRLTDQTDGVNGDTLGDSGGAETAFNTLGDSGWAQVVLGINVIGMRRITAGATWNETHRHTSTSSTPTNNITTAAALAGQTNAGNNVQPTIILNKIIKY